MPLSSASGWRQDLWTTLYRRVNKYMPEPGLTKIRGTLGNKTCLSSDVASIAFTHFLNSPHPSLKYDIQFIVIEAFHNGLPRLEKTDYRQSFESVRIFL
jgi:hypothetical protein